jgi:hypothetical protein
VPPAGLSATTGATVPMPTSADGPLAFELMAATARGGVGGGRGGGGARGGGGVARGTGGGGVVAGPAAGGTTVNLAQLAARLEGHQFTLTILVAPVR